MNKLEAQKRILQNGKPLDLEKFHWDEETRTLSTNCSNLVIDFMEISGCTFTTGNCCTFTTSYDCTFDTGSCCTFRTGNCCTFNTGGGCTFKTAGCCTFRTGSGCTFTTYDDCTFTTSNDCTFDTGSGCVIVNRNISKVFEVITPKAGDTIQICPFDIEGHLVNGLYKGEPHIIADGILSKIISKKGNVYKVINHGEEKASYLIEIERDGRKIYSHGKTIKEAKADLVYKLSSRNTDQYKDLDLNSKLSKEDAIRCYMTITGACANGTKYFVDNNKDKIKSEFTIKEIIDLTEGQYGNCEFKTFFNKKE